MWSRPLFKCWSVSPVQLRYLVLLAHLWAGWSACLPCVVGRFLPESALVCQGMHMSVVVGHRLIVIILDCDAGFYGPSAGLSACEGLILCMPSVKCALLCSDSACDVGRAGNTRGQSNCTGTTFVGLTTLRDCSTPDVSSMCSRFLCRLTEQLKLHG